MFKQLKNIHPIARKEHTCMLCGKTIKKGETYNRQTCVYDGIIYDWIQCDICNSVSGEVEIFDNLEEDFLTQEDFRDAVDQYVNDNHYDEETDDISKDWQLQFPELVEKVYHELLEKKDYDTDK